jgi:chromosome segregation ATPase
MTTEAPVLNPYQERHKLHADRTAARVARDTIRGRAVQVAADKRQDKEEAHQAEKEMILGTEGAEQRRDAALERVRTAEQAERQHQSGLEAADALLADCEGKLKLLYDSEDGFTAFAKEAEATTAGAVRDLQDLRRALAAASQSWGRASALWRPLNPAIKRRLDDLDATEGQYGNTAAQAAPPVFPISLPSDLASLAPRPRGMARLEPH